MFSSNSVYDSDEDSISPLNANMMSKGIVLLSVVLLVKLANASPFSDPETRPAPLGTLIHDTLTTNCHRTPALVLKYRLRFFLLLNIL